MDDADFRQALLTKLVEEAQEAAVAMGDALIGELADVLEVVDALCAAHNLDPAAMRAAQSRKRAGRGGFSSRLRLRTVG